MTFSHIGAAALGKNDSGCRESESSGRRIVGSDRGANFVSESYKLKEEPAKVSVFIR
jgi:hypothetical protein